MTAASPSAPPIDPIIHRVLHPSDFSEASMVAFAHALKAALIAKGKLALIHVTDSGPLKWTEFPGVRETLERWKLLPPGSPKEAVADLGIDVTKVIGHGPDPVKGVLGYLSDHTAELIVLATHHHGMDWLHGSISEPVARKSNEMTLFVPAWARGFVSPVDGSVSLRNVLIPIAATPSPELAITSAVRLIHQMQCESGTITLLHVGEDAPWVATPSLPGWTWQHLTKPGHVIEVILETANQLNADLIVMPTDGRNGFLDALRGSHSERVLRQAPCPLLAIPELSFASTLLKLEHSST